MSLSISSATAATSTAVRTETPATTATTETSTATQATSAGVGATPSGFDTAAATTAAPPPPPVRGTEVASLLSTPEKLPAADYVRTETKLDAITQAALPTEREAVRAHFEKASSAERDAAFTSVLTATQTAGAREVELGPFKGHVTVDGDGRVNGAPLASDRELAVAGTLASLSEGDRRTQLRQVGVDEAFIATASDAQLVRAFNEVELTRRFGEAGSHGVALEYVVQRSDGSTGESATGITTPETVKSTLRFDVGAGGTIGAAGQALARPTSEAVLRELSARELAEWPAGRPESRTSTLTANESVKLATLTSVLEPAKASEVMANRRFITNESINAAYDAMLEARATPGSKPFTFELDTSRAAPTGVENESGPVVEFAPVQSMSLSATLDVTADGKVNGKPLLADEVVRLAKQTEALPGTVKDLLLKDAGVPEAWLGQAGGEKDLVLAQLRLAAKTPGEHVIDLNFSRVEGAHLESGGTGFSGTGSITVSVDAQGKVNGKAPLIDAAIATQATFDRLPMGEKRLMLSQLGLPAEAVRGIQADQATAVLTSVSMLTTQPGQHSFDFGVSGKPWQLGLKIGEGGKIEGVGAQRIPEQSFGREFFDFACTVVSVVFPVVAPVVGMVRAAVAYEQGQRGFGLVANVAAAVAGGAGMAGASWAATAANVANVLGAANGLYQAAKSGDPLAGFSSIVSLAFSAGDLSGSPIDSQFELWKTVGKVAGGASALINGDLNGLAGQAFGAIRDHEAGVVRTAAENENELQRLTNRGSAQTTAETGVDPGTDSTSPTGTDFGLGTARLGEGGAGVRLGTGDDGSSLDPRQTSPAGQQIDKLRFDNELEKLRPQTRADFNRAHAGAVRNGETTFQFDMNDGRGMQQYTTQTRADVAGTIPGGSTADYQRVVRQYFGGIDSDLALATYREALTAAQQPVGQTTPTGPGMTVSGSGVLPETQFNPLNFKGLNYFKATDGVFYEMLQHPAVRDQNVFVVMGHGNSEYVADQRIFGGRVDVLADDLTRSIQGSANWNGKPIVLLSCNTGTGGSGSYAQDLANRLGVPVAAPDSFVGGNANGAQVGYTQRPDGTYVMDQNPRGLTWFTPKRGS